MPYKIVGLSLYLLILLAIGIIASRRVNDVGDYFAAGKKLSFWSVAFSSRATGESGWLLLGLTGMGATLGAQAFWIVIGETIGVAIAWLVLSRRFRRLTGDYDSITVPDYLESRFGDTAQHLRRISAIAILVFVTVYVAAQIDATGQAFDSFLGVNYYLGAAIGFVVVMIYIVAGGFLAVVWSDVFQGLLMLAGLVFLPIWGLIELGGVDELTARLDDIDTGLTSLAGVDGWSAESICAIIGFVMIGLGFIGAPQIFVRFLALRDEREITKGAAVAIGWTVLADSGAVLVGMIGRAMFEADPGQTVLPQMVDLLPAVIVGVYIAVVMSAIMSTVDSLLVLGGSAVARDYYQKVRSPETPDAALVPLSRRITLILAVAAFGLAMLISVVQDEPASIFWFVLVGFYGLAATFGPTIVLSLF
ncbi:MAG: sodium/proline symporter, partial [Myxococcota bacterium]